MAKNFFYRINPTEVMAAAGFEVDREKWFIRFFRDLMNDDPELAITDLAKEYIQEAHDYRQTRSRGGIAKACKYKQVLKDAEQESAYALHMHKDAMPVAVAVTESQNLLPGAVAPAASKKKKTTPPDPRHSWLIAWWGWAFTLMTGDSYRFTAQDAGIVKGLLKSPGFDQLLERACVYLLLSDQQRFPRGSPTIKGLAGMVNQIAGSFTIDIESSARRVGLLPPDGISIKDYRPWAEREAA